MGSWFANYFSIRSAQVSVYDTNEDSVKALVGNYRMSPTLADCVPTADIVIVCVPVQLTPKVIAQCVEGMKNGAVIAEISSVKHKTFPALAKARSNVHPLCIHPMFGPGASEKNQLKMLLVPVRDQEAETKRLRERFEGLMLMVLPNAKAHDEAIAVVLGLTYFVNIAFAKTISRSDIELLKHISGTTFGLQSMLAESILTDDPELMSALVRDNPFAAKQIKRYIEEASTIAKLASKKKGRYFEAEILKVKKRLQMRQDLQESYKRLYDMVQVHNG